MNFDFFFQDWQQMKSRLLLALTISLISNLAMGSDSLQYHAPFRDINKAACQVPIHFPGAAYEVGKNDSVGEDREDELSLCSWDFNQVGGGNAVAVCPKLYATNPALMLTKIPDEFTKAKFEKMACEPPKSKTKKLAKFKVSITCSYTPSILTYYHLSRILGNVLHIPVAVAKSVPLEYYKGKVKEAVARTSKEKGMIAKSWRELESALNPSAKDDLKEALLTKDQKFVYGALIKVMKKEKTYKDMIADDDDEELVRFRDTNKFLRLLNSNVPIDQIIKQDFEEKNVQTLVAMRDLTNMLIMDYLLKQEDRNGNISYKEFYYWKDPSALANFNKVELKRKAKRKLKPQLISSLKPILIHEMALKDNDCGISFRNTVKDSGLLKNISHISQDTYSRMLWFQSLLNDEETRKFFMSEALMPDYDWEIFKTTFRELTADLKDRCLKGSLRLDLNLNFFEGVSSQPNKSLCEKVVNFRESQI